ncbi:MAG: hypothetical protein ACI9KE_004305 [Polyangiales bacterium]|jgi:hypothetical protein
MPRSFRRQFPLLALTLFFGCQGAIGETGPEGSILPPVEGEAGDPTGVAGIRRLSPIEVRSTVRDLLSELGVTADETLSAPPLADVDTHHQFSNARESGNLTFQQVRDLMNWAEAISVAATEDTDALLGCSPSTDFDECARTFSEALGRLAFRRPTDVDDMGRFETAFVAVTAEGEPRDGVRALIELALLAPEFWYLSAAVDETGRLDPHAIASQLSYGLWGTMPDATLRERAEGGFLSDATNVRAEAERMLDDPRAGQTVRRFHREWLDLATVSELDKDPAIYPDFSVETAVDLGTEYDAFVERSVLEDAGIGELFSSRQAYVNARLERLYGLTPESNGNDDWHWRELGPERAGVLTRPLFLASTAGRGESALILRGVAVIEHLLCTVLIAPANATEESVEIPVGATSGKLAGVENRASKAGCRSCHNTIDPIGVAFEVYDAVGAFREEYPDTIAIEQAGTLPASGFLAETIDYANAAELNVGLSQAVDVQECYASKWMEHLTGQTPNAAQRFELGRIASTPDISIRELIVEVLVSPMFLERLPEMEESP